MIPILNNCRRWECPSCDLQDITWEAAPHTRMHNCPGLKGLSVPMVPEGTKATHKTNLREDYVGREMVQTDDEGRPVMSVTTIREDGQDCTVFAPCAYSEGEANNGMG